MDLVFRMGAENSQTGFPWPVGIRTGITHGAKFLLSVDQASLCAVAVWIATCSSLAFVGVRALLPVMHGDLGAFFDLCEL